MLFSNYAKCNASERDTMDIDEACLTIEAKDSAIDLWTQYVECHNCPLKRRKSILRGHNESFVFRSRYTTILEVTGNKTRCRTTYNFEEHAGYLWQMNTNCTEIKQITEADVSYLPILEAIIIFFCFATIWYAIKHIYKRSNPTTTWAELLRFRHISRDQETNNAVLVENQPLVSRQAKRFRSVDVFRGICICLMIFVNYGGGHYWFFEHSLWNGFTVADAVFPFFLWIMGFCMKISLNTRLARQQSKSKIIRHLVMRSVVLILIGVVLNSSKMKTLAEIRFPGVLQRIGITCCIVGCLELYLRKPIDSSEQHFRKFFNFGYATAVCIIVFAHLLITFYLPVPGCPKGYLGPGGLDRNSSFVNCTGGAAGYLDRLIFGRHLYDRSSFQKLYETQQLFDPEGLLSTLTSLLTVFNGLLAAQNLLFENNIRKRIWYLTSTGCLMILIAGFLSRFSINDGFIPINKNLWSMSFVALSSGLAYLFYALLHWIIDIKKYWFGRPFIYVGMNSLVIYVGHMLCAHLFPFSWLPSYGTHREFLYMNLTGTVLWILIAIYLYKINIFITL